MGSPFIQSVRDHLRARQYSKRTEQTYTYWIAYYIRFYKMQHPSALDGPAIVAFLEYLALQRDVTPSTQKTALNALMYLYRQVLGQPEINIGEFSRATRERKLPVVLTREEVRLLLAQLEGDPRACAELMYGSGLRVMEVCRLRVKDIDLDRLAINVREGKGRKQRITTLSDACIGALQRQLAQVKLYWEEDKGARVVKGVMRIMGNQDNFPASRIRRCCRCLIRAGRNDE